MHVAPHYQGSASSDFANLASNFQGLDFAGLLPNTQKGGKKPRPHVLKPTVAAAELGRSLKSRTSIRINAEETSLSSYTKPQLEQQPNGSQMITGDPSLPATTRQGVCTPVTERRRIIKMQPSLIHHRKKNAMSI